jgi:hypothetical protein
VPDAAERQGQDVFKPGQIRDWKQGKPKYTIYSGDAIRRTTSGSGPKAIFGVPSLRLQPLASPMGFPSGKPIPPGKTNWTLGTGHWWLDSVCAFPAAAASTGCRMRDGEMLDILLPGPQSHSPVVSSQWSVVVFSMSAFQRFSF